MSFNHKISESVFSRNPHVSMYMKYFLGQLLSPRFMYIIACMYMNTTLNIWKDSLPIPGIQGTTLVTIPGQSRLLNNNNWYHIAIIQCVLFLTRPTSISLYGRRANCYFQLIWPIRWNIWDKCIPGLSLTALYATEGGHDSLIKHVVFCDCHFWSNTRHNSVS